ncbi:MAG: hypothetical protein EA402_04615 [Planctomycetota bacterium]|nr:MAG: hypothetical protein EA402_04615 [Planctomycetota bacterium]
MSSASHHPHPCAQAGASLLRTLVIVIALALLTYVAWVTWRSYARSGEANPLAVFDAEERRAAHGDARPHMNRALELGSEALATLSRLSAETFGDGGYIDQASSWMRRSDQASPIQEALEEAPAGSSGADTQDTPSAAPTAAAPAPSPSRSPETRRMEAQILAAEQEFQKALRHYEAANPAHAGWTPERREHVRQAHQGFSRVRDQLSSGGPRADLYDLIETYGRQADHNPQVLARAREMAGHNQRLLTQARRMSSSL